MTTRHHQELEKSIAEQAGLSGTHDNFMKGEGRRRSYHTQVAGVLATAFTLSLFYAVVVTFTGSHEGYTMADPALWPAFALVYGLGFAFSAPVLKDKLWVWWTLTVFLLGFIMVGIFYYPTIFPPSAQTPFAWFENDVYMGLLILAEYLCVQRLRDVTLTPGT